MLESLADLNTKQKVTTIVPLLAASLNFIVNPVLNIESSPDLFSNEFLTVHQNQYGNYGHDYFILLFYSFQHYSDLHTYYAQLIETYNDLVNNYTNNLQNGFLREYLVSNNFGQNFQLDPNYDNAMEELSNNDMDIFLNRYNAYRDGIRVVEQGLQQIQPVNPDFILAVPPFDPVEVTPAMWLLLNHPYFQ